MPRVGSACKSATSAHAIEFTHPTRSFEPRAAARDRRPVDDQRSTGNRAHNRASAGRARAAACRTAPPRSRLVGAGSTGEISATLGHGYAIRSDRGRTILPQSVLLRRSALRTCGSRLASEQLDQLGPLTAAEVGDGTGVADATAAKQAIGLRRSNPGHRKQQFAHLGGLRAGGRPGQHRIQCARAGGEVSLQLGSAKANLVRVGERSQSTLRELAQTGLALQLQWHDAAILRALPSIHTGMRRPPNAMPSAARGLG